MKRSDKSRNKRTNQGQSTNTKFSSKIRKKKKVSRDQG